MYKEKEIKYDSAIQNEALEKFSKAIADFLINYKKALKKVPTHLSKEELVDEAVWRMKALGLSIETIDKFIKEGKISYVMEKGSKFPLNELDQKQIKELDEKGFLVYAAVRQLTMFGRMTAYIVVSSHSGDWPHMH